MRYQFIKIRGISYSETCEMTPIPTALDLRQVW